MHKQGSTTIARYDYTYNGQPRPMKMKWNGRSERHRYHVARQRGTIAETSREKVSSHITTLLFFTVFLFLHPSTGLAIAPR
jgi:hypothetical protein